MNESRKMPRVKAEELADQYAALMADPDFRAALDGFARAILRAIPDCDAEKSYLRTPTPRAAFSG
jgi:hypothetical protein